MERSQHLINVHPKKMIVNPRGAPHLMMKDDDLKYIRVGRQKRMNMIYSDLQGLINGDPQETNVIHSGAQELMIYNGVGVDQYFTSGSPQPNGVIPSYDQERLIHGEATCINFVDQYWIDDIQQEMMSMTNNVQEYLIDHGGTQGMNVVNGGESDYAYLETLPIGYRFKPDDTELIYCLRKKVNNEPLPTDKIYTVNLYDFGPHNLADYFGGNEVGDWYFITSLKAKNKGAKYADRTTPNGCWKATSGEHPTKHGDIEVGFRKTLVYYEGKHSKTDWIMHEYRLKDDSMEVANALVICKIHNKRKGNMSKSRPLL